MRRTPQWQDPAFQAKMDRERRRSRVIGWTLASLIVAYLLFAGILMMKTIPKDVPDDQYVEQVYRR